MHPALCVAFCIHMVPPGVLVSMCLSPCACDLETRGAHVGTARAVTPGPSPGPRCRCVEEQEGGLLALEPTPPFGKGLDLRRAAEEAFEVKDVLNSTLDSEALKQTLYRQAKNQVGTAEPRPLSAGLQWQWPPRLLARGRSGPLCPWPPQQLVRCPRTTTLLEARAKRG